MRWLNWKVLIMAGVVAAAVFWTLIFAQFTVDDAFICFRYGQTLYAHHVWNWNPAGPRVEAYTSSLYAFLSILPPVLHLPPALIFKAVGLLSLLGMVVLLKTAAQSTTHTVLALAILLVHPFTWVHVYSCLETPLFMFLLLWMVLAVIADESGGYIGNPFVVYTLAVLLPLTRPEGAAFAAVGLLLFWYKRPVARRPLLYLAVLGVLATIYFIVRWKYFGAMLPNPFYVKVAHGSLLTLGQQMYSMRLMLAGFFASFFLNRNPRYRVFCAAAALVVFAVYLPHKLEMDYCDRFAFQVTMPLVLAFAITLKPAEAKAVTSTKLAFVTVLWLLSWDFSSFDMAMSFPYLQSAHVALGKSLAPYAANHTLLGGDMGAIPYYSDWVSYDYMGLCSAQVAHHGLTSEFLKSANPDLILLYSNDSPTAFNPWPNQETIAAYMADSGDYVRVGAMHWKWFYVVQYLRRSTPQFDEIERSIQEVDATNSHFAYSRADLLRQKYLLSQFRY